MKSRIAIVAGLLLGVLLSFAAPVPAARNSGGTFSLVAGNPVATGTTITTTWANNTLGDIATEITNSLERNGKGGMLAPLRTPNGTVATPSHSFTSETGSGLYRIGAADVGMSVTGTKRQEWTSAGSSINGTLDVAGDTTVTGILHATGAFSALSISTPGYVSGTSGLVTTSGTIDATGSNVPMTLTDNRAGGDAGSSFILKSTATRTAGSLLDIKNNATSKFTLDYNGEPSVMGGFPTGMYALPADVTEAAGTPTNISGFEFTAEANATYIAEVVGFASMSGSTSEIVGSITVPASPTALHYANDYLSTDVATTSGWAVTLKPAGFGVSSFRLAMVLQNGANAGAVHVRFHRDTAGTATIYAGSVLRWRRVA